MGRNSLCPCGSGKRYKRCCGMISKGQVAARFRALAAHRENRLSVAETLYREALAEDEDDVDVVHMLGVVLFQRLRYSEALSFLRPAAEKSGWSDATIRRNLGLLVARLMADGASREQIQVLEAVSAWQSSQASMITSGGDLPLVSVVVATYNHRRYVEQAIASVREQTYANIELIVIDDGSSDETPDRVRSSLLDARFACQFLTRSHRGMALALNEGATLARGRYLAFLRADDCFLPQRIERLVAEVAARELLWGFSLVAPESAPRGAALIGDRDGHRLGRLQRAHLGRISNSFAFLRCNAAISPGNLFVETELFRSLGGFRELGDSYGWDFCLRAAAVAEPKVVWEPLYVCRGLDETADQEFQQTAVTERARLIAGLLEGHGSADCTNPLAPQWPGNRLLLVTEALRVAEHLPPGVLRNLVDQAHAVSPSTPQRPVADVANQGHERVAIVVLGMHRSGTSALARIINLCGAFLPEQVLPPSLQANPKGYWETRNVHDLNERMLASLGGAWDRVDLNIPDHGDLVNDFLQDALSIIRSNYGDQQTIVIKDPRIAVLAPLWHRVLIQAGYRPAYVVVVRDPLEVAQSLCARGDMSIRKGLSLWHRYVLRIVQFASCGPDIVFVAFEDLIDDWRHQIRRVSDRLGVDLSLDGNEAAIEEFLDPNFRRQRGAVDTFEVGQTDSELENIRQLHVECLRMCVHEGGPGWPKLDAEGSGLAPESSANNLLTESR